MKLSIVIPAYNEQDNITHCVAETSIAFPDAEIVVVNDASTDATAQLLATMDLPNLKVVTNMHNQGHGFSVVKGLRTATGDFVMYIDADRQIDISGKYGFWDEVPVYRFTSGWRVGRYDKFFRKIISFCLKTTILLRYGYFIRDANCPYKIYDRESLLPLLDELPKTFIIPIACLEVIARKHKRHVETVRTPHKPYPGGERTGKLQSLNPISLKFFWNAFWEIVSL